MFEKSTISALPVRPPIPIIVGVVSCIVILTLITIIGILIVWHRRRHVYIFIKTEKYFITYRKRSVFYIFISYCHYGIFRTKKLENADGNQIGMNVPVQVYKNNPAREQAPELSLYNSLQIHQNADHIYESMKN